jgi:hypothetical protein
MVKIYCLVCILCSLCIVQITTAQTTSTPHIRSTAERFKQDFEIKDIANPSEELLSKINISDFDYLRQPDVRVEAKDGTNKIILVLYSVKEIREAREARARQGNVKTVTDVKYIFTPKIH